MQRSPAIAGCLRLRPLGARGVATIPARRRCRACSLTRHIFRLTRSRRDAQEKAGIIWKVVGRPTARSVGETPAQGAVSIVAALALVEPLQLTLCTHRPLPSTFDLRLSSHHLPMRGSILVPALLLAQAHLTVARGLLGRGSSTDTAIAITLPTRPTSSGFSYLACYTDNLNQVRGLSTKLPNLSDTASGCLAACFSANFVYCGVEY